MPGETLDATDTTSADEFIAGDGVNTPAIPGSGWTSCRATPAIKFVRVMFTVVLPLVPATIVSAGGTRLSSYAGATVIVSAKVVVALLTPGADAVTVTVLVAGVAVPVAVRFTRAVAVAPDSWAGSIVALTPSGRFETVRETTPPKPPSRASVRSEEHTSELQSRLHLVCR